VNDAHSYDQLLADFGRRLAQAESRERRATRRPERRPSRRKRRRARRRSPFRR